MNLEKAETIWAEFHDIVLVFDDRLTRVQRCKMAKYPVTVTVLHGETEPYRYGHIEMQDLSYREIRAMALKTLLAKLGWKPLFYLSYFPGLVWS